LEEKNKIMKRDYLKYFLIVSALLLFTWTISCSGRSGRPVEKQTEAISTIAEGESARLVKMVSPEEDAECHLHGQVRIILQAENKNGPDSVKIWFDSQTVTVLKSSPWEHTLPEAMVNKTGRKSIKIIAYRSGDKPQTITRFIVVYSDTKPARNGYKVIQVYPHDKEAFTQGLVYENGFFYEGTGQPGSSCLRKVDPATGKVESQVNLEAPLFGEGITIFGDRIYQVTWQNKVGFVYDKSTLKQINKVYYQTEGWGLTTMGNKLVMSDGTNFLYFLDPDQFSVTSKIEVYDNEKKVDQLNELEFINGEIWANIWNTDLIARIDPLSGKVLAYIDLKGILNDPDTDTKVDVLNGIAYDKTGNRIFVTGKNWPKLFEIKVTE
jgi:glutaminyl-peptide cyclotransferase